MIGQRLTSLEAISPRPRNDVDLCERELNAASCRAGFVERPDNYAGDRQFNNAADPPGEEDSRGQRFHCIVDQVQTAEEQGKKNSVTKSARYAATAAEAAHKNHCEE